MVDKLIRCSETAWRLLRAAAFNKETHIKTVLDDVLNGKLDPMEIEIK
jgi:hypothetical protein